MRASSTALLTGVLVLAGCGNAASNVVDQDTHVEEEPYIECTSPDDCVDLPESDECQQRTCVDNLCALSFTEEATAVTTQVTGDCRQVVCDGTGAERFDVDDTDLPDDGFECTEDLCTEATPSNPPLEAGTPCSAGVCDGAGACVGCNTEADCGTDTFCRAHTCVSNVCGISNTPAGTALPAGDQTPNDCKLVQCDGDGAEQIVEDATDLPADDGSDCTEEVCTGPTPEHLPLDEATWCGAARIQPVCNPDACDAAGTCVDAAPAPVGTPCGYALFEPTCNPDACDDTGLCIDQPFAPDDTVCSEFGGNRCRSGACTWVPIPPPEPTNLGGCATCTCCDPWWIEWDPVVGATYYQVEWKCSMNPLQIWNVGLVTRIDDVCIDIDMCNGMCPLTVGFIDVRACDDDACSDAIRMPAGEIPLTCGGGCCC